MSEWKEYSGSDEQIDEIAKSRTDVLLKYRNGVERLRSSLSVGDWQHPLLTHYLICNRHQLADMICQQARTGQPVYVKLSDIPNSMYTHFINTFSLVLERPCYSVYVTNKPDWNIEGAEYSFTSFDE